jgi:hypothetical protein
MNTCMVNEHRNRWAFNLLLLLIPIYLGRIQEMIPFLADLHIAKITMGIALLIFFLTLKGYAEANAVLSQIPQVKYIIALVGMALLSIPFSAWPGGSFNFIVATYVKLLLFVYLLVWCVNSEEELNKICWVFVLTILAIDIVACVKPSEVQGRVYVGSTYDPNDMALMLVIAFPVTFYMMERNGGWKKILLCATMLMSVFMILKTGSRGGFVAFFSVLCIMAYHKGTVYVIKRIPILLILIFALLSFSTGTHMERFNTILAMQNDYNTTDRGGRLEIWKRGLSLMLRNPLLGCGVDQFTTANGKRADGTWQTAHNSFIQIGAELGVVGLVLFVMMIKKSIHSLREAEGNIENKWLVQGIRTGFYGFCVGGFFLSWAYFAETYFLIALSIIVQKISLNKRMAHAGCAEE